MKRNKVLLSVGLICLSIFFGAPLTLAEEGVTDTEIKIGSILDLTGPAAGSGTNVRIGHKLLIDYVNSQGGIHGRKIVYMLEDDKYSPPQSIAAAKKLVTRDRVFIFLGNMGTPHVESVAPFLEENKIPLLFPNTAAAKITNPPKRYVFGLYTTTEQEARLHADYIANIIENPKVFVQYFDSDFGKGTADALEEQLGHYGIKLVGRETHKYNTMDFSSHALKAKEAGANVMAVYSLGPPTAKIALECKKINYNPQFIHFSSASVDEVLNLAGPVLEGTVGTGISALYTLPHPELRLFQELAKKAQPGEKPKQVHQTAFFQARTMVEALKQCGRDLTREKLIKTLETWKDFDAVAVAPLTYNENRRQGADAALWYTIKNSRFVYLVPGWHIPKKFN